jgi:hypothetical protein
VQAKRLCVSWKKVVARETSRSPVTCVGSTKDALPSGQRRIPDDNNWRKTKKKSPTSTKLSKLPKSNSKQQSKPESKPNPSPAPALYVPEVETDKKAGFPSLQDLCVRQAAASIQYMVRRGFGQATKIPAKHVVNILKSSSVSQLKEVERKYPVSILGFSDFCNVVSILHTSTHVLNC